MNAHPELARAGGYGGLELGDTVPGRPCDSEALGEILEQLQLLDQLAVAAVRLVVLGGIVARAQHLHLLHEMLRDVLSLHREPRKVTSRGSERHRDFVDGLAAIRPNIGERQPPYVHVPDVAPSTLAADLHLRDRIANDLWREAGIDDDAVGDLARELQRLRAGSGEVDR